MRELNIWKIQKQFINLLGEGSAACRPTQGIELEHNIFKILPIKNYDPEDEVWEFPPGTLVRCESREYKGEEYLLAVEKVG